MDIEYSKKYTAIIAGTKQIDQTIDVTLSYGDITGPYYDEEKPKEIFDTEEEAIKYAYTKGKYYRWIIVPVIMFNE